MKIEKISNNRVKVTFNVSKDDFDHALDYAYNQVKEEVEVKGFRKGHCPKNVYLSRFGEASLYEKAIDNVLNDTYYKAVVQEKLRVVAAPHVDFDFSTIGRDKEFTYTAEVEVYPDITLGEYKGVEVTKDPVEVSEEEVTNNINQTLKNKAELVLVEGRALQNGDTAVLDFEGFVDGVAFEGGKGENYDLELGSGSFIPGFEDQLVGFEKGAEVDVHVTFPTSYHAENLAGKESLFKCKIHAVKEKVTPILNDEFALMYGIPTLDQMKIILRHQMDAKKKEDSMNSYMVKLCDVIVSSSTFDIDETKLKARIDEMVAYYENAMKQYGTDLNGFLEMTNQTLEQFIDSQIKNEAEKSLKIDALFDEVAKEENIEVSEEEINHSLNMIKTQYQMSDEQFNRFKEEKAKEIRFEVLRSKVSQFLYDNNN